MSSHTANRLLLLAAAALFSTGGAAIKACALTSWQVASLRSLVAAVTLIIITRPRWSAWNLRIGLVGLAYALTLVSFVTATKMTTAANAVFLQAAAPLYLLALSPLVLKEPVRRADLVVIAAVCAGGVLLFVGTGEPQVTAANPGLGNVIAVASGVTWAFTIAGFRWLARGPDKDHAPMLVVITGNALAFALAFAGAVPFSSVRYADLLVIGYLGVFQIAIAYIAITKAVRHAPALEVSVLLLLEPVLNPVWTWLVHCERVTVSTVAGAAIIVAATALNTWWHRDVHEVAPSS